jgi:hypothetical protein
MGIDPYPYISQQGLWTAVPHPRPTLSVSEMAYHAVSYAEDLSYNYVDDILQ